MENTIKIGLNICDITKINICFFNNIILPNGKRIELFNKINDIILWMYLYPDPTTKDINDKIKEIHCIYKDIATSVNLEYDNIINVNNNDKTRLIENLMNENETFRMELEAEKLKKINLKVPTESSAQLIKDNIRLTNENNKLKVEKEQLEANLEASLNSLNDLFHENTKLTDEANMLNNINLYR